MSKYHNIFLGNQTLQDIVADSLGYDTPQEYSWFTKDIYMTTFFYLTKRFGSHIIHDDYKQGAVWEFQVKEYVVEVELNSSWVIFKIYGEGAKYRNIGMKSPYYVKHERLVRNSNEYIDLFKEEKHTKEISEKIKVLFKSFCTENGIDDSWDQERFEKEKIMDWIDYVSAHNKKTLGLDIRVTEEKHGTIYRNSKTRRAGRVLSQFLKNMLTPIYIRDVGYNIKGQCGSEYDRYIGNIEIECVNEKQDVRH